MKMTFIDEEIVRKLEWAEARGGMETAKAMARFRPDINAEFLKAAGGAAIFCGVGSPLTQALGCGVSGEVAASEFDILEDFFRSRGAISRVVLSPFLDPSLLELLNRRSYQVVEFENLLVRSLEGFEVERSHASTVEVRLVMLEEAEMWAETVARGFGGDDEPPPVLNELGAMVHIPEAACFIARVDGQTAGGAAVIVNNDVATICGASTLVGFRKRGVQSALLKARLDLAQSKGCNLAMVATRPGSQSQRNVERFGFRVAYTRVAMHRHWTDRR